MKNNSGSEKEKIIGPEELYILPYALILLGYVGSLHNPLKSGFHFSGCVPLFWH